MSFGISNSSNTFMRFMYRILQPFLGKFIMVYFDDILIYNSTWASHFDHFHAIFERLKMECLFVNKKKCYFFSTSINCLGFIVSTDGVHIEQSKIGTALEWPKPKTLHNVRSFHGPTSFLNGASLQVVSRGRG